MTLKVEKKKVKLRLKRQTTKTIQKEQNLQKSKHETQIK